MESTGDAVAGAVVQPTVPSAGKLQLPDHHGDHGPRIVGHDRLDDRSGEGVVVGVRLDGAELSEPFSYYLVYPADRGSNESVKAFRDWLFTELDVKKSQLAQRVA